MAEFLGSSNILRGDAVEGMIRFDGFEVPAGRLGAPCPPGPRSFSLRPQDATLHLAPPADDAVVVPGTLVTRSFLGESWEYGFKPAAGGKPIRVVAPPSHVLPAGTPVWLTVDPARLVALEDD